MVFQCHRAPLQVEQTPGDNESQTSASWASGEERFEQAIPQLGRDARPAVAHGDAADTVISLHLELHPGACGGLTCIQRQVQHRSTEHVGIGTSDGSAAEHGDGRVGLTHGCASGGGRVQRDRSQIDRLQSRRPRLRIEQQIAEFLVQFIDALDHGPDDLSR
jgi:hypothetical protein